MDLEQEGKIEKSTKKENTDIMQTEAQKKLPIGFFDSGLGGISVLKEAVRLMPGERFIYYGDSKNAPYGVKKTEEIKALTYAAVEKLLDMGIKGLAVACNTATSAAVRQLRLDYPNLPIVGIEPAVKPAVEACTGGRILVMATPMTIKQEKFHILLSKYEQQAEIIPVPCAGLMEFVENGDLESEFLDSYYRGNIAPYITEDTETIVLGCTHYSFLRPHLRQLLIENGWADDTKADGCRIALIDGTLGTSMELKRRLNVKGLLSDDAENAAKRDGMQTDRAYWKEHIKFLNSKDDEKMIERSWKLFQMPIM